MIAASNLNQINLNHPSCFVFKKENYNNNKIEQFLSCEIYELRETWSLCK